MTKPPADPSAAPPRTRMAAAVLFSDDRGRVLIVEPAAGQGHWGLPGGAVGAGESPMDAALRGTKEALGLRGRPGRLLAVDWMPARDARPEGLTFVYDGGALPPEPEAAIRLPAGQWRSWRWCGAADAAERLSPLLDRRAAAALQAARDGTTAYLENGYARP
ncbi:NUDIX domain-containing protein [Pilimelia terevasa]|uniref:NUDIX domain-containing protein n=1 Tax=Pilimelia terevasa TaxID=53372 RepID=UPI001E453131|nr:NUDIX domain-containing protein [Pilimelia terevasa]